MKKNLWIGLGVVGAVLLISWMMAAPTKKFKAGEMVPALSLTNIHGLQIQIPNLKSKLVHLQFRRFAGCPICNLHLQTFVQRHSEIVSAGVQEIVIFHSPKESLLPFQGKFPFDVIADPEKTLYAQFGVGTSIFSLLDLRVWPKMIAGNSASEKPTGTPEGGPLGLPADFLIASDGKIIASHYGRHAYDQWSVDDLLKMAQESN